MSRRLALQQVVSESMIHIIEPVADQSVRFLVRKLGLEEIMKENIYVVSDFKESSKTNTEDHNAKLIENRVVAKLTPNVNPVNNKWEGIKTTIDLGNGNSIVRTSDAKNMKRPWSGRDLTDTNFSIFHDPDLFIDLTEWNVASTLALEIKLDFYYVTNAQETLSKIFATFMNGDMMGYIPLQYDYPIPKAQQNVIKYLYKISDHPDTEEAFTNWLKEYSKGCISYNTNRNNINIKEMVGLRNNAQAFYLIECTQDAPEVGSNRYTVNLNMTVQYSRTNRLILDYPIIANNKLVDFRYVPMRPEVRSINRGPYQWQNRAVDQYWKDQYFKNQRFSPVKYPWWDPWFTPEESYVRQSRFAPIFTAAITLDDVDNPEGTTVLDLEEGLPGYKLSDRIIEMLRTGKRKVLGTHGTYVNVSVFSHDYQVDTSMLDFDGRYLTIKSRRKSPTYRLVISLTDKPDNMPQINWVWITTIIVKKGE